MGSFAETNIKWFAIAQKFLLVKLTNINTNKLSDKELIVYNFLKEKWIKSIEEFKKYTDQIWDDFLKENLLFL